jgi:hypothetical protein
MIVPACDRPTVAAPTRDEAAHVMESEGRVMHRKMQRRARQLPITGSAHKAAVVGDCRVSAVLAARDVAAEGCRAAVLDGAHHLELVEAHMTAVGITPCGAVAAEDVRDLQSGPGHGGSALCRRFLLLQRQPLQRAHHRAQHVGGDMGVAGGRIQLRMAQQYLDHPHVDIALQ